MQEICEEYYERMYICEGQKWDLEYEVRKKDWEVLQQFQFKFSNRSQSINKCQNSEYKRTTNQKKKKTKNINKTNSPKTECNKIVSKLKSYLII